MIDDILPSDVEFARGMIHSSRPDAEILSSLASRGLAQSKAARLLDDLRHGRKPEYQGQFVLGSTAHRTPSKPGKPGADTPPVNVHAPSHPRHRKHTSAGGAWWFAIIVIIFLWALWYAFFKTGADASKDVIDVEKHSIPDAPNKEPAR